MSVPTSLMQMYTGANRGGYGGYGSALTGGGRLASALGGMYGNSGLNTAGNYLGNAGSALGVLGGLQRGGVGGYGSAAINAGKLAGNLSGNSALNQGAGALGNLLGIYQGVQKGGLTGYGGAAANAAQLAGSALGNSALSAAGGYIAAPLAVYNAVDNWQSGKTGSDTLQGAEAGAAVGSIIPGVGTLIGGAIGAGLGALSSAFGSGAKDPETDTWSGYKDAYNSAAQQGQGSALASSVQNPYLPLAGLFDLKSGQVKGNIPIYDEYGQHGEQKFTNDMVNQINQAEQAGKISSSSTPQQIMSQVVDPWISGFGKGKPTDVNTAALQGLLTDMVGQYQSGQAQGDWKAVGGDTPFSNLQSFGAPATPSTFPSRFAPSGGGGGMQAMNTALRAEGGSINEDDMSKGRKINDSRLRELYARNFSDRPRYDDGGSVNYYDQYISANATPYDPTSAVTNWNPQSASETTVNDPYGSYTYSPTPSTSGYTDTAAQNGSSSGSGSGFLGGLGSLLGVNSMGQLLQQYGALAPILASALGGNKSTSAPATPSGYGTIPSIATPANQRSYSTPNIQNWYTYGQGPEASFFQNNQLPSVPGLSPAGASSSSGQQPTNPTIQPILNRPVMARGGATFDSQAGDNYVHDQGDGDGTSDPIDARLSPGEYVVDAGTVSMLGNGSNDAGARALDQLRQRVRQHAGKQHVKGKQFMKAKAPEQYLKKGAGGNQ